MRDAGDERRGCEAVQCEVQVSPLDQLIEAVAPNDVCVSAGEKYRIAWSSATWPEGASITDADRQQAYQRAYAAEVTGKL